MKRSNYLQIFAMICGLSLLAGGCLFKSTAVPTRHFILTSVPPPEHATAAAQPPAVEVGDVKLPSYLLGDSMVIRKSDTEVGVFQNALWSEQLNQGFRRVLEDDLSALLASAPIPPSASGPITVGINVLRFDVDTQGQGTLIARWQLTHADSVKPLKSGLAHLTRPGPSPIGNPQVIATTLSTLIADFSQELAQNIRDSAAANAKSPPNGTVFHFPSFTTIAEMR